eukprot:TRINITY_DN3781_c0_g1_i2.p1 TRINITY_DN3781_c0_g1~~TRINITY_DN3781_c0_g1_i2.p1  ORF type:complete len:139 (+),score=5.51 TRINITY_DN3781_c0_g1_i2:201-617(+)
MNFEDDGAIPQTRCAEFKHTHFRVCIVRTILMILTGIAGIFIDNISSLIGLVSGFTLTLNGFILGPLCYLRMKYDTESSKQPAWRWGLSVGVHTFLILTGTVVGCYQVYLAIRQLEDDLSPKNQTTPHNLSLFISQYS